MQVTGDINGIYQLIQLAVTVGGHNDFFPEYWYNGLAWM